MCIWLSWLHRDANSAFQKSMSIIIINWERVTAQVIRVSASVMHVHPSVDTCKRHTREQRVANKNCRKALSLTIRYGYLTAGDCPAFCVQHPPTTKEMMGFVHCKSGDGSTTLNSRLVRLLAVCNALFPLTRLFYWREIAIFPWINDVCSSESEWKSNPG